MVDLLVVGLSLLINFNGGQVGPTFQPDDSLQKTLSCPAEEPALSLVEIEPGVKVNTEIYLQTGLMLKDAAAAGQPLHIDNSYRTCAQQVELRKTNCETVKAEDIFTKDPKTCKIPTELPGRSLHGAGLAVDLRCDGTLKFEESPCYQWMQQNAAKYGFQQYELEPWHWSPTGQ